MVIKGSRKSFWKKARILVGTGKVISGPESWPELFGERVDNAGAPEWIVKGDITKRESGCERRDVGERVKLVDGGG